MQKTILVTGGLGFIGSHLVQKLIRQNHSIVIVDNQSSNAIPPYSFIHNKNVVYYNNSVDNEGLGRVANLCRCDEIYHLASPVGPAGILQHAGNIIQQVCDSTYAVMDLAKLWKAKLVDVSTSELYGQQSGLCSEDMPRVIQANTTVRLEYAVAKLAMETALINTTRVSDLEAVIVRPFNVAGPRQSKHGGFVLPRFVEQALNNEALTVFGTGEQIRAFTHVCDIADGLILAMEQGKSGEVYNLGNPANRTTINALAEQVIQQVGSGYIEHVDPRSIYGDLYAEAPDKCPDSIKASVELGWTPCFGIEQIIGDIVEVMLQTA